MSSSIDNTICGLVHVPQKICCQISAAQALRTTYAQGDSQCSIHRWLTWLFMVLWLRSLFFHCDAACYDQRYGTDHGQCLLHKASLPRATLQRHKERLGVSLQSVREKGFITHIKISAAYRTASNNCKAHTESHRLCCPADLCDNDAGRSRNRVMFISERRKSCGSVLAAHDPLLESSTLSITLPTRVA